MSDPRRIISAELLSIGTEIVVGETRDTNAGELARGLVEAGVEVTRITALPDRLPDVRDAFRAALGRADLVVSTGGLGPTPDDLTREAIAAVCGEEPAVDPGLEAWLRDLWARRGLPFPEINLKQAWLIPSAAALPNEHGTAPGWYVERPDGRVVVALPGPPREMRPMWGERVLPRLRERGLGRPGCVRTYRLTGIGESQVAALLGEQLLRTANPVVATYARADAVDVRISASDETRTDGEAPRSAEELVDEAEAIVLDALGPYVWGRDAETWPEAIGERLDHLGWRIATSEHGTGGSLATLIGSVPWLLLAESLARDPAGPPPSLDELERSATEVRARSGADAALAVGTGAAGSDSLVRTVVVTPAGVEREERTAFLSGPQGRHRAALIAAADLLATLRAALRDAGPAARAN
ncbi:MAG: putative CinA-like protein [Chloroflexota bacterium]